MSLSWPLRQATTFDGSRLTADSGVMVIAAAETG